MSNEHNEMDQFHWLIDMVQTIEVGIVVLDKDYNIQLWNGFMENHSGISPKDIKGENIFSLFDDETSQWLKQKMDSVFLLKNRAFISSEQRPYVFKFKNYRPITGLAEFMYQNVTLMPLTSLSGEVDHISMLVYDVTDATINKRQLTSSNTDLQHLSQTDELTQLNNRRFWQTTLQNEYDRYARYGDIASLIMFDIDHFKTVNDTYGHIAGDMVLQKVATYLQQSLRDTDLACRYGGEEFCILLPQTDKDCAFALAERLRVGIEALETEFSDTQIKVTISLGVSGISSEVDSIQTWLSQADEALYKAKDSGRNRTEIFISESPQLSPLDKLK